MRPSRNYIWTAIPKEEWEAIFHPEPDPQLDLEEYIKKKTEDDLGRKPSGTGKPAN